MILIYWLFSFSTPQDSVLLLPMLTTVRLRILLSTCPPNSWSLDIFIIGSREIIRFNSPVILSGTSLKWIISWLTTSWAAASWLLKGVPKASGCTMKTCSVWPIRLIGESRLHLQSDMETVRKIIAHFLSQISVDIIATEMQGIYIIHICVILKCGKATAKFLLEEICFDSWRSWGSSANAQSKSWSPNRSQCR